MVSKQPKDDAFSPFPPVSRHYPDAIHEVAWSAWIAGSQLKIGEVAINEATGFVYVTDGRTNSITVYDSRDRRFLPPIPVGRDPRALALIGGGSLLVVANHGEVLDGDADTVTIVDTVSASPIAEVLVGNRPTDIVADGDGRVFVANSGSASVSVLSVSDPAYPEALNTIELPDGPVGLALSQGGLKLYASISLGLAVIDGDSGDLLEIIPGIPPGSLAITANGDELYVTDGEGNGVVSVNLSGRSVRIPFSPRACPDALCVPEGIAIGSLDGGCSACVGDCNGDRRVQSSELRIAVEEALSGSAHSCRAADPDVSEQITVDEVIQAVINRRETCSNLDPPE